MSNQQLNELHKLSQQEKIQLVQLLWEDIASEQNYTDLPEEHKKILDKRLEKILNGTAKFRSWEEIQKKYKRI